MAWWWEVWAQLLLGRTQTCHLLSVRCWEGSVPVSSCEMQIRNMRLPPAFLGGEIKVNKINPEQCLA